MKRLWYLSFCMAVVACTEPEDKKDKLEIRTSAPITIAVGDTSDLLVVSKTVTGATGRTSTTNPYVSFQLASGNDLVAKIAVLQRIVGFSEGETMVVARDEKSQLVSDSVKVIVVAKP